MFDSILLWLNDASHLALVVSVLIAVSAAAKVLGYPLPVIDSVIALLRRMQPAPQGATALAALSTFDLSTLRQHPMFDQLLRATAEANKLPESHPLVEKAAFYLLLASPALLALFPPTASLAPFAALLAALLHKSPLPLLETKP